MITGFDFLSDALKRTMNVSTYWKHIYHRVALCPINSYDTFIRLNTDSLTWNNTGRYIISIIIAERYLCCLILMCLCHTAILTCLYVYGGCWWSGAEQVLFYKLKANGCYDANVVVPGDTLQRPQLGQCCHYDSCRLSVLAQNNSTYVACRWRNLWRCLHPGCHRTPHPSLCCNRRWWN